jgi:hypothetical protein
MHKRSNKIGEVGEVLYKDWMRVPVNSEVIAAVDRVVLRGHPVDRGAAVITDDDTRIEAWPRCIQIGPVTLYLMQVYPKNGAQEAQYERRPGIEVEIERRD